MIKQIILILLFVGAALAASQAAPNDKVLVISVTMYENGSFELKPLDVMPSDATDCYPGSFSEGRGNYAVKVLYSDGTVACENRFFNDFTISVYPPPSVKTDRMIYMGRVRYSPDLHSIEFYRDGELAWRTELPMLCEADGACAGAEDSWSCPQDCTKGDEDGVCDAAFDGVCDKDCFPYYDADCTQEENEAKAEKFGVTLKQIDDSEKRGDEPPSNEFPWALPLAGLFIVVGGGTLLLFAAGLTARHLVHRRGKRVRDLARDWLGAKKAAPTAKRGHANPKAIKGAPEKQKP